jgi:hypothetical protein
MESPPFAGDRSEWNFIVNAQHSGGVLFVGHEPGRGASRRPDHPAGSAKRARQ